MNPYNKSYINKKLDSNHNIPKYYNSNTNNQNSSKQIIENVNVYQNKKKKMLIKIKIQ